MKKPYLIAALILLSACSSSPPSEFTISSAPLQPGEMALDSFGKTSFAARAFDVVNQDLGAAHSTGIAGKVDPSPVDILSSYAAKKFKATGGPYATRFVIKRAAFTATPVETVSKGWLWDTKEYKVEMTVNVNAGLVASRADGMTAQVNATTAQSQQISTDSSMETRRKAYLALMARAVEAIDGELNKQLPQYFDDIVAR